MELFDDVKRRFYESNFVRDLGMELISVEPGVAVSRLNVGERFLQQDGYVHAGVVSTLADHTGGASGWTLVSPSQTVLTVEFKIHFLNPARGPMLDCRAKVLRGGRKIIVSESDVFNADGKHAAKLTMTLAVVDMERLKS